MDARHPVQYFYTAWLGIRDILLYQGASNHIHRSARVGSALKGMINLDSPLVSRGFHSEKTFPSGHYPRVHRQIIASR
jgi:hypothetical protein